MHVHKTTAFYHIMLGALNLYWKPEIPPHGDVIMYVSLYVSLCV